MHASCFKVARKARNRLSASQLAVPATEGSDLSSKNYRRRPTVSRPSRPGPDRVVEAEEEEEKGGKDEVKVAKDVMDAKPPPQPSVKLELAGLLRSEVKWSVYNVQFWRIVALGFNATVRVPWCPFLDIPSLFTNCVEVHRFNA